MILEKSAKILSYHCTCMVGIGETYNHVAVAMFQVEAAVRTGLVNLHLNGYHAETILNPQKLKT